MYAFLESKNTFIADKVNLKFNGFSKQALSLIFNGFVRIDGDIDGDLDTDGAVIISEKAKIKGNLKAKSAIIGGIVLGDISAREGVKLLSTSVWKA